MKLLLKQTIGIFMLLLLISFLLCFIKTKDTSIESLYENAMIDAMVATDDEIEPLVTITVEDPMTTWDHEKEHVLLLTWNSYPDSYIEDQDITLSYGPVWTFTDRELIAWYDENRYEIDDYSLRFNQLIGLRPEDKNTHFTAMWVSPDDIVRPAYSTNIQTQKMDLTIDTENKEYKTWFENNILGSYYGEYDYPWTRLGYTYDWANNGQDYGLTEFLVKENANVHIEYTMDNEQFYQYLDQQIQNER